jgi:hypothetical protein
MARKKVCIIGNSHVAAWKLGMEQVPEWGSDCETDFFAGQSDLMRDLELRDGVLHPTSELTRRRMMTVSGDKTEIPVGDYTHFVVIGLGLNTVKPVELLRELRVHPFERGEPTKLPYVSQACFGTLAESLARASTAVYITSLLREATDAQVIVVPQPFPSETVTTVPLWRRARASGAVAHVAGLFESNLAMLARELDCEPLVQPPATVVDGVFTAEHYSTGSIRLGGDKVAHPETEPYHMNAAFGAEMLRSCLAVLR